MLQAFHHKKIQWQYAVLLLSAIMPWSHCAVLRCDSANRDPCTKFPDLCTEGGGLCVITKPCEYECVCRPDGRRGRDCSRNGANPNQSKEPGQSPANTDSHVESLLVFPKDLFWDMNHVGEALGIQRITSPIPIARDPFVPMPSAVSDTTTKGSLVKGLSTAKEIPRVQVQSTSMQPITIVSELTPQSLIAKLPNENPASSAVGNVKTDPNSKPLSITNDIQRNRGELPSTESIGAQNGVTPTNSAVPIIDTSKSGVDQNFATLTQGMSKLVTSEMTVISETTSAISVPNANGPNSLSSGSVSDTSMQLDQSQTVTDVPTASPRNGGSQSDKISSASREAFPGHEMFPTFFEETLKSPSANANDKPNAPLSFVVQRVFHRPELFPMFRRNRH